MMNSLKLEKDKKGEGNMIKDVKNIFRLKKEVNNNTVNSIKYLFRPRKENEAIKDRIIRSRKKKIILNQ